MVTCQECKRLTGKESIGDHWICESCCQLPLSINHVRLISFSGLDKPRLLSIVHMIESTIGLRQILPYSTKPIQLECNKYRGEFRPVNTDEFFHASEDKRFMFEWEEAGYRYGIMREEIEELIQFNHLGSIIVEPKVANLLKAHLGSEVVRVTIAHEEWDSFKPSCDYYFNCPDLSYLVFDLTRKFEMLLANGGSN